MHGRLPSMALAPLASRIRSAREARKLSQEALARTLNVSRNTVADWEKKGAIPGYARIPGLAAALGVSEATLLGWIREELEARSAQLASDVDAGANAADEELRGGGGSGSPPPRVPGRRGNRRRGEQPS